MQRTSGRLICLTALMSINLYVCAVGQEPPNAKIFSGHLDAVLMGAFAPSGSEVVTGSFDHTARVWNVDSATELRQYSQHTGPIFSLAISGDGQTLVTGSQDNTLRTWDLPSRTPRSSYADHAKRVNEIALSSLGDALVSVSAESNVRLRSPNDEKIPLAARAGHTVEVTAVDYRNDGAYFATGDQSGRVILWSPYLEEPQGELLAAEGPIHQLRFHPNNQQLLTASNDGLIRVWQLPLSAPESFPLGETRIVDWAVIANQAQAVCVTEDSRSFMLNLTTGAVVTEFPKLNFKPTAIALPPNNAWVAIADDAGKVHLLNINDGTPRGEIVCHTGRIIDIAVHPDSTRFATSAADGSVSFWAQPPAAATDEPQKPLQTWQLEPNVAATSLAFASDQQYVFSGASDGKIRQWNLGSGELAKTIDAHSSSTTPAIRELVLVNGGQSLITVGSDKTLRGWATNDGPATWTMPHATEVLHAAVSPDNSRVVSAAADGIARVWDLKSGRLLQSLPGHSAAIAGVGFVGDAQTVVSVADDKSLRRTRTAIVASNAIHSGATRSLIMFAGGAQTLSCGDDDRILLSNTSDGAEVRSFRVMLSAPTTAVDGNSEKPEYQPLKPTAVAARNDNQRVAAGIQEGEVLVWNAGASESPLQRLKVDGSVVSLSFSPDNQKLAITTASSAIYVFGPSLPNVQPTTELVEHQRMTTTAIATDVVFSPDSQSLWVSLEDGKVEKWNYAAIAQRRQMNHGGAVYGVAVTADGKTVVSCSADQTIRVWDNTTGGQRFQLNGHTGPVHAIAMSRDEGFVVSSGADGTLRLWDIVGGRQLKQLTKFDSTMYSVALHPNGQLIAAAGSDRNVHLINLATGEVSRTLEGHTDYLHCVAFDPTGSRLLSYGYAGHLKLWNPADGQLLHQSRIGKVGNYAQFSPDGTKLILSNGDGTARAIPVP